MSTRPHSPFVRAAERLRGITGLLVVIVIAAALLVALAFGRQPSAPLADGHVPVGAPVSITAQPSIAPAAEAESIEVAKVANAQDTVTRRLVEDFGVTCLTTGDGTLIVPADAPKKLDQTITASKVVGEGWVEPDKLWLGTPEHAAKAFGAVAAYSDDDSVWIIVTTPKGTTAHELYHAKSASGKDAWAPINAITPC